MIESLRPKVSKWILVVFFTLIGLTMTVQLEAQSKSDDNMVFPCDNAVSRQDVVVSEALNALKNGSSSNGPVLIVILRHSIDEPSPKLQRERLYNLDQYFRDRGSRLEAKQVLIAVGKPVQGHGRIEYYLNGKLAERLLFPKQGFICHECCGPDERYYPDRGKKRVRRTT